MEVDLLLNKINQSTHFPYVEGEGCASPGLLAQDKVSINEYLLKHKIGERRS